MRNIPYGRQQIDADDIKAVIAALKSDWLTQGPHIIALEEALCRYTGARYAVAVSNGTAALHLAYKAAGMEAGDEVITSPNTFVATANAALYVGAKPVFADIDPATGNIDPKDIERKITRKTKFIVPVHYAGAAVDMQAVVALARRHKLMLIEDACHALGGAYRFNKQWHQVGAARHSSATVFSFHPVKSITTAEGGAVMTNDNGIYKRLLHLRNHGIVRDAADFVNVKGRLANQKYYMQMQELGFNYRLTELQSALGVSQLKKLDVLVAKRRHIAAYYRKAFAGNPYFCTIDVPEAARSAHHLFPVLLSDGIDRDAVVAALRQQGIGVQMHYIPAYWHPYYQEHGYAQCRCQKAEDFYRREISLPIFPSLNAADLRRVVKTVLAVCDQLRKG